MDRYIPPYKGNLVYCVWKSGGEDRAVTCLCVSLFVCVFGGGGGGGGLSFHGVGNMGSWVITPK